MGESVRPRDGMLLPSSLGQWFATGCWDRAGWQCQLQRAKSSKEGGLRNVIKYFSWIFRCFLFKDNFSTRAGVWTWPFRLTYHSAALYLQQTVLNIDSEALGCIRFFGYEFGLLVPRGYCAVGHLHAFNGCTIFFFLELRYFLIGLFFRFTCAAWRGEGRG